MEKLFSQNRLCYRMGSPSNLGSQILDAQKLEQNDLSSIKKGQLPEYQAKVEKAREITANQLKDLGAKNLISTQENASLINQLKECTSETQIKDLSQKIKDLEQQNEKKRADDINNSLEIPFEDQKIQHYVGKIQNHLKTHAKELGAKNTKDFEEWCIKEIKANPSVNKAKSIFENLHTVNDNNGTKKRIEYYNHSIKPTFNKLGLDPQESKIIKEGGLSERTNCIKNIQALQNILSPLKAVGLFTDKVIQSELKKIALCETAEQQKDLISLAEKTVKVEQQHLISLNKEITVEGVSFYAMSKKSKKFLLENHSTLGLTDAPYGETRLQIAPQWPKFVEAEAKLAYDIADALSDYPDLLKKALQSFKDEGYMEKIDITKKYKERAKEKDLDKKRESLEIEVTINSAVSAIKNCKELSDGTKANYEEWFRDEDNHVNPKTQETGDLEQLKRNYLSLISPIPHVKNRNLAAYKAMHDEFYKLRSSGDTYMEGNEEFEGLSDKLAESFNDSGWKKREEIIIQMKSLIAKAKDLHKNKLAKNNLVDQKKSTESAEKKEILNEKETIKAANKLIKSGNYREAMQLLLAFDAETPGNSAIRNLIAFAGDGLKLIGDASDPSNEDQDNTEEESLIAELSEEAMNDNEEIVDEIQFYHRFAKSNAIAERQVDGENTIDRARERAIEELDDDGNEEGAEIVRLFHEASNDNDFIDADEGIVDEVEQIEIDNTTDSERKSMINDAVKNEELIRKREGSVETAIVTSSGQELGHKESQQKLKSMQEREISRMANEIDVDLTPEQKAAFVNKLAEKIAKHNDTIIKKAA